MENLVTLPCSLLLLLWRWMLFPIYYFNPKYVGVTVWLCFHETLFQSQGPKGESLKGVLPYFSDRANKPGLIATHHRLSCSQLCSRAQILGWETMKCFSNRERSSNPLPEVPMASNCSSLLLLELQKSVQYISKLGCQILALQYDSNSWQERAYKPETYLNLTWCQTEK